MIKLSVQNTRNFERFYNLLMQHVSEMLTIFVLIKYGYCTPQPQELIQQTVQQRIMIGCG